jgi:hypothetical protein
MPHERPDYANTSNMRACISNRYFILICTLFGLHLVGTAQKLTPKSTSSYSSSIDGVIAQVVDGSSWKTIITLVNLDTDITTYTILFYADDGSPMVLATTAGTGAVISGTLQVGGSTVIETPGTKANLSQGWAYVRTSNTTGGNAIFRQSIPGRPDFEASMPIVIYVEDNDYILPFDNITSSTGVAVVNPLSYTTITIFVSFRDEQGKQFYVDSFTLGPLQHAAFSLSDRFPQSVGRRGVVELATPGLTMNMLGLRAGAASFTSVLPLTR